MNSTAARNFLGQNLWALCDNTRMLRTLLIPVWWPSDSPMTCTVAGYIVQHTVTSVRSHTHCTHTHVKTTVLRLHAQKSYARCAQAAWLGWYLGDSHGRKNADITRFQYSYIGLWPRLISFTRISVECGEVVYFCLCQQTGTRKPFTYVKSSIICLMGNFYILICFNFKSP